MLEEENPAGPEGSGKHGAHHRPVVGSPGEEAAALEDAVDALSRATVTLDRDRAAQAHLAGRHQDLARTPADEQPLLATALSALAELLKVQADVLARMTDTMTAAISVGGRLADGAEATDL